MKMFVNDFFFFCFVVFVLFFVFCFLSHGNRLHACGRVPRFIQI